MHWPICPIQVSLTLYAVKTKLTRRFNVNRIKLMDELCKQPKNSLLQSFVGRLTNKHKASSMCEQIKRLNKQT